MHPFTMEALVLTRRSEMELTAERARLAAMYTRSRSLGQLRAAAVSRWQAATARRPELSASSRAGELCCS